MDIESKALLTASNLIAIQVITSVKTGKTWIQVLEDLVSNTALRTSLEAAVPNIGTEIAEVKAMTSADYFDLAQTQLSFLADYVTAMKATA